MKSKLIIKFSMLVLIAVVSSVLADAQTNAITYQGKLNDAGQPANGTYDFTFRLFSAVSGGTQIGSEVVLDNVPVTDGVFAVNLNFGTSPFTSATGNFLEIAVRPGAATGAFTILSPRLSVSNSPYSIKSGTADNAANALQLGGVAASQYVLTTDSRLSDARNPLPNSPNYINNSTSPQPSSNFNISGNGTAGGTLSGNTVNAATQFNIGDNRILGNPGSENLFAGIGAGASNTTGFENSFFGFSAGRSTTVGINNSFFGSRVGMNNFTGNFNSFFGHRTGENTNGSVNSFFGTGAGINNNLGNSNSFFGHDAGDTNTTGSFNTLVGENADVFPGNLTNATAIGSRALVSQSNTLVLGSISGFNGATADTKVGIGTTIPGFKLEVVDPSNTGLRVQTNAAGGTVASFGGNGGFNIDAPGVVGGRFRILENGTVFINNALTSVTSTKLFVNGIIGLSNLGAAGSTPLCHNASNQISTCSSSLRYKSNVNPFNSGLSLIGKLRPVSFNWKDGGRPDLGLVAEEVFETEPLLVTKNGQGEIEGVKYDRVGVILVNAVQEQQTQIETLKNKIDGQNRIIKGQNDKLEIQAELLKKQQAEIEALKALVCIQNPSAQICQPEEER